MAVHLLSLPGSTLVPSSDDQPHRINLCYRAPSYPANQRVWLTDRDFNHGFQTRYRSPETLAPTQRIRFAPKSGHRRPFYRWRGTARTSCLTVINRGCAFFPYTTFDNISASIKGNPFETWDSISGYRIKPNGRLQPLPGSPFKVAGGS